LARIDAREQEIERLLEQARRAAAGKLAEARGREAAILETNKAEAEAERTRVSAEIVAEARRRSEEMLAAGAREAAAIRSMPPERIDRAAAELLRLVLPDAPREAGRS
jgi:vacuolar-type H+-ATPase subunit H